ncbi:MAG: hypothetical protein CEE40_08590 [Chloroflexi bacterium B3_Chlor]|nr:MAG: hypothetical protein CEE40_08590 [Chloroflexi bacterium B3_Chlor]
MIRPRVFVLLATMVALTVALVGGLACQPSAQLGEACTGDSDCAGDLVCVMGECVQCRYDKDCDPAPQRCIDNQCIPVECLVDADCDPEETCVDGECVEAEPECTANQDCQDFYGEGWECTDGTCVEAEPECTVNQDCENLHGEGWECTDGTCVEAEPTPAPLPEEEPVLPFILGEFQRKYNDAVKSSDEDGLESLLFQEVINVYTHQQCRANLEAGIENTPPIDEILDWTGPERWTWHIDGLSIPIDNTWAVTVVLTDQDREVLIHLAEREDGSVGFLTDCGDPLPPTDVMITLSGYVPLPVEWPEVYLVRWPDGVTVGEKEYLEDTCLPDPEEALHVYLDLLKEAGSAPVDPETGEFSLLVSAGSFSFWYGPVYCPDGSYRGYVGSPRTTVSGTDTEVPVGELTDQIHCSCD